MLEKKLALLELCKANTQERIFSIRAQLAMIEESRNGQTKSSAGDKYETGRAMMQMEESKLQSQLTEVMDVTRVLNRIKPGTTHVVSQLGSLVCTDQGKYFLSIGMGKAKVHGEVVYCTSMQSPVGAMLTGVRAGDVREFRGKQYSVEQVI